jgi:hypothetical protein
MSLVWSVAPCRENSLLVLLALADWANDDGACWPSIPTLAEKTRIDRRSVQRIIRRLQSEQLIEIEEGRGRGNQHRYTVQKATLRRLLDERKGDFPDTQKATFPTEKAALRTEKATLVSPDPLEEPLVDPPRGQDTPLPPKGERRRGNYSLRVSAVFQFWQRRLDHPQAKLDEKRARLIQARLRDYTIDDLKRAIEGCAASPFHMGENDTGHVHDDISLICRDASHVEMFMGKLIKKPTKDRSLELMAGMGIEWKPRYVSSPEEYAALSGKPVEEVRAKWN